MIQRCPECGKWCETNKQGVLERAANGLGSGPLSGMGEKYFGKIGGFAGALLDGATGLRVLNGVCGDKYQFECPNCGCEWSTDDEADDQTREYERERAWIDTASPENAVARCRNGEDDSSKYVSELYMIINSTRNEHLKAYVYDTLSYCYREGLHDKEKALVAINNSLNIVNDKKSRVLRGIYNDECRNAKDSYERLRDLMCIKVDGENPFYPKGQIERLVDDTASEYADAFLTLPYSQRKFLMIVPSLDNLPDFALDNKSIKLLPENIVPNELRTLNGSIQPNVLYMSHPYTPNFYIPVEGYKEELLKDECRELQIFLQGLGAKTIRIVDTSHDRGNASSEESMSGSARGGYSGYSGSVSGETSKHDDALSILKSTLKMDSVIEQGAEPAIIESGWYKNIKEWQDFARMRKGGQVKLGIEISTQQLNKISHSEMQQLSADFDLIVGDGSVKGERSASFQKENEQEHCWELEVEFYPLSSYKKQVLQPIENSEATSFTAKTDGKPQKMFYALIAVIVILIGVIAALLI